MWGGSPLDRRRQAPCCQRMPLIEFMGLPASGKTTVARELHRLLQDRGQVCRMASTLPLAGGRNLPRKVFRYLMISLAEPAILVLAVTTVLGSRQRRLSDAMRTLGNLLEVRYVLHAAGGGIVIMDQGPCQALWSVAYSATRPTAQGLRRLAQTSLPRRRLVVLVASSPGQALARSAVRRTAGSRIERGDESTAQGWVRAVRALRVAGRAVARIPRLTVANPEGQAGSAAEGIIAVLARRGGVPTLPPVR